MYCGIDVVITCRHGLRDIIMPPHMFMTTGDVEKGQGREREARDKEWYASPLWGKSQAELCMPQDKKGKKAGACKAKSGDSDSEEESEEEEEEAESLRFQDNSFVTGNLPCVVHSFAPLVWVKVRVPSKKNQLLKVPWGEKTLHGATLNILPLKPFTERVVDLAQGMEWEGPVHVEAGHIMAQGKFYVAVTRCRDLRMLKISGVSVDTLRAHVKSNWRAIKFLVDQGETVPATSARFAKKAESDYNKLSYSAGAEQ